MKIKLKSKHWKIVKHYSSSVNTHKYPDFELNEEIVERFIRFESYGEKSLSREERISINPLVGESWTYAPEGSMIIDESGAKGNYELTKKMVHEEISEWWTKGYGWYYPLASHIYFLFRERHKFGTTATKEYISIFRKIKKNGIVNYFKSLKGSIFSEEEIILIFEKKWP